MPDPRDASKKPIGESTPITIGLMIAVLGVAVAAGKALQVQTDHGRQIAANGERITVVEHKQDVADERAYRQTTDLELLKKDVSYTREAIGEVNHKLDLLIDSGGVSRGHVRRDDP